jgi:hypothetical protein
MSEHAYDRRAPNNERELGELSARITALEDDVKEARADIRQLLEFTQQARGSWKMVMGIAGASAAIGAAFAKIIAVWPVR